MSLTSKEWITYIVIIIFTLLLFWLIVPKAHYQPQGIALPMTKELSNQIKNNSGWNGTGTPTQWINLEYHVTKDTPRARDLIKQKGLALAKKAGANSFELLNPLFYTTSTEDNKLLRVIIARGIGVKQ